MDRGRFTEKNEHRTSNVQLLLWDHRERWVRSGLSDIFCVRRNCNCGWGTSHGLSEKSRIRLRPYPIYWWTAGVYYESCDFLQFPIANYHQQAVAQICNITKYPTHVTSTRQIRAPQDFHLSFSATMPISNKKLKTDGAFNLQNNPKQERITDY